MPNHSLLFLVLAAIAALHGFGGSAGADASLSQTLFILFLVVWAVSMVLSGGGGNKDAS